jgi:DMSO/TMAO reductase YedYZ molybdopterin-dependent catalytic subunit
MAGTRLSRRSLLGSAFAGAVALSGADLLPGLAERAVAGAPAILKPLPPAWFIDYGTNAEMRWDSVDPAVYATTQERMFVRNHVSTPTIDASTYSLRIFGDGLEDPAGVSLTLDQLKAFPNVRHTSVHECTGNGRSFFTTQQGQSVAGTKWTLGAVASVQWDGVRLADVLRAVGIRPDAVSIMSTGLDPHYVSGGVDYGPVRRPFPVAKAFDDALLAWGVDGAPLLPDHGYPLRLVLPGWIGIASTKWLGSLEVSTSEQSSPWSTTWYNIDGPLTANPVRSAFELPWNAQIPAGPEVTLTGRSWSGAAPIAAVEISVDGGATWRHADLGRTYVGRGEPHRGSGRPAELGDGGFGWTQWSFTLRRPAKGPRTLMARATDQAGRTQPDVAAYNPNGYFFDAVVRHPVTLV